MIESAHATAFSDVPAERRREMFEQLRPFMSDAERTASPDDPHVLAKLVRRAEERVPSARRRAGRADAEARGIRRDPDRRPPKRRHVDPRDVLMQTGVMAIVAYQFTATTAVSSYFTVGAGSLVIGDQPGWVGDMVDPGSTGIDAAASAAAATTAEAAATTAAASAAGSTPAASAAASTAVAAASAERRHPRGLREVQPWAESTRGTEPDGEGPVQQPHERREVQRYVYVLDALPARVIEEAHRQVLATSPAQLRRQIGRGLRPFLTAFEATSLRGSWVLARAIRRERSRGGSRRRSRRVIRKILAAVDMPHGIDARLVLASAAVLPDVATGSSTAIRFTTTWCQRAS